MTTAQTAPIQEPATLARDWPFVGGGEMGERMRAYDWARSPLGPVARWPRALKVAVSTLLECQLPMFVAWGDRFIQFYNDAYRPILGNKHPSALGASTPECWNEIWPRIGPMWERVRGGDPIGFEDFKLTIDRYGYPEDCWFNFSYSPVRDDEGHAAGVLVTFAETTRRVRSEARLRFLDDLSQATRALDSPEQVMQTAARMLGSHLHANRCAYAHVLDDQDTFDLIGDYNDGVHSIVGRYRFTDFGDAVHRLMVEDKPYVNHDVDADARTAASDLSAYRLTGIRSVICMPLHKEGRFVAAMAVHQAQPRHWTPEEIELVRTVVDRCWEALDRMRSNAALADANRRLALAMHAGGLGEWHWDAATDAMTMSDAACDIFGVPRGQAVTRSSIRERLYPDDQERALQALRAVEAGAAHYAIEYRLPLPDGGVRWIATSGRGLYSPQGALTGMVGVAQDVTQRRLEQERAATETRLLEVLNRTGAALSAELDLQVLLQRVTDAATELAGAQFGAFFYNGVDDQGAAYLLYTLAGAPREAFEHLGHPRPTALFGPTFRGEPPIRIDDVLQDPRYGQWGPHHGMPKGHLPVRSYLAVPVISRTGEVIGGLFFGHATPGVFTERSERLVVGIAGQAAIAVDNARLYAQAQQLAEERRALLESERAARSEAERASSLKDEFLATLSHELRTPLSAILGWVHILRRRVGTAPDLIKGVDVIERSTRMQVQLIDDLLDMSRITSGKLLLEKQPVAPIAFVQAAIDVIAPSADAAGVDLTLSHEPVDTVLGDSGRLQQVVWNLLANAVKFTPRGGRVSVTVRPVHGRVAIDVADTGAGINRDFVPHLFERFRQADGSITRKFGGLGLGLSIVKHIVELHGGTVRAQSAGEGQGATFTIELPGHRSDAPLFLNEPVAPRGDASVLQGARILVVDDEANTRDLLSRLFGEHGADVTTADGAGAALEHLRGPWPDLIVSDIGMPDVDGYELMRRIRRMAPADGGRVAAIAFTAFARPEDRTRALEAGFDDHLTKPMDPMRIVATAAGLLERRR
jgi:PAS domain S-box-containing protein